MMGLMSSVSLVSFSMEMFSSEFSSPVSTSKVRAFAGFVEDALGLLGLLEQIGDLRQRGHAGGDARAEEAGDPIENHKARRDR